MIHFTRCAAAVASILKYGFLYLHNGTVVHQQLFQSLGIPITDIERGMICFTDIGWQDSKDIRREFGDFGIVVDSNWAFDHGARRVAYIPDSGPIFESLKSLIHLAIPNDRELRKNLQAHGTKRFADDLAKWLRSDPSAAQYMMPPLYSLLLDLLQWVETSAHQEQREYRIRNPQAFGNLSTYSKAEQVKLLIAMMDSEVNFKYSLSVLPKDVLFLCCERDKVAEVRNAIAAVGFQDTKIEPYA